jgi:hypothetical protein
VLFADWFFDGCFYLFIIFCLAVWALESVLKDLGNAAGEVLKNEHVQQGILWWLFGRGNENNDN